ncbi:MAG: FKBP-type peptidyl-prolyl cis-trans isomerase, partial [Mucilaginibacter sp.]
QIITPGTGARLNYSDNVSFVFSIASFDGKYVAADTVINHYYQYLGHASPLGLTLGIHNDAKFKGAKVRFLIPSHLAYGISGVGTGSKTVTNGRIAGNQCLDYTVNLVDNQVAYDQQVIKSYMAATGLTGYTETASGLWYKILTQGTGVDPITYNSTVLLTYTGYLMNNVAFSSYTPTGGLAFAIPDVVPGFQEGLKLVTTGAVVSYIMPSALGYSTTGTTGVPSNSCIRYDCTIVSVSP